MGLECAILVGNRTACQHQEFTWLRHSWGAQERGEVVREECLCWVCDGEWLRSFLHWHQNLNQAYRSSGGYGKWSFLVLEISKTSFAFAFAFAFGFSSYHGILSVTTPRGGYLSEICRKGTHFPMSVQTN